MLELLIWLSKAEDALASSLAPVSKKRRGPSELSKVVAGKRKLSRLMRATASGLKKSRTRTPAITGMRGAREDVDSSLSFLTEAVLSGMDGRELAETLAIHEYLKWNNLFLTLANAVKNDFPEAVLMLARAQRSKRAVEGFIETEGSSNGLFRLRASEPAWRERFLLIGQVCGFVEDGLKSDGIVETIPTGKEAIELLRHRYYGALVTDEELPDVHALELCRRAARLFPGIEERFLFLYGSVEKKAGKRHGAKGPRRIQKAASFERVLEEVGMILDR